MKKIILLLCIGALSQANVFAATNDVSGESVQLRACHFALELIRSDEPVRNARAEEVFVWVQDQLRLIRKVDVDKVDVDYEYEIASCLYLLSFVIWNDDLASRAMGLFLGVKPEVETKNEWRPGCWMTGVHGYVRALLEKLSTIGAISDWASEELQEWRRTAQERGDHE